MSSLKNFWVRPAILMLLALTPLMAGCGIKVHPSTTNVLNNDVALDPYALSGGKITHFVPEPGLPNDPADKAMLMAYQYIPTTSSTARSAILVVAAGQFGKVPLHALVAGQQVLMLPGDLARMGIEFSGSSNKFVLYPRSPQSIILTHNSKVAYVGKKNILLHEPVIATKSNDLVMTMADMLAVFHERDVQRHQPPFIRDIKIIYDIRDYHR